MEWAVVVATVLAGVIGAAAAIVSASRANRDADRRARLEWAEQHERDRLADLRRATDDVAVALHRLWAAYGPFMHAMHPNENLRYPDRSPVGGHPDPVVWQRAFDDLQVGYARLAVRLPDGHPLLSAAGLVLNHAQVAWNDIVLGDASDSSDERKKNVTRGVATASQKWREFQSTARELFGADALSA
jgi:hypothetical protein